VTFTGGEPSLAPEVIEEFRQFCLMRKIDLGWFYCATNGMPHNRFQRFIRALDGIYAISDEQCACGLEMSQDQFHPRDRRSLNQFMIRDEDGRIYDNYVPYFNPKGRTSYIPTPLNEGRARETGVGTQDPDEQRPWEVQDDYVFSVSNHVVYIACNGNVVSNCNMSFNRIDAESKGNVLETPLYEIIDSYCIKEGMHAACVS
jgi:hypothetical protein